VQNLLNFAHASICLYETCIHCAFFYTLSVYGNSIVPIVKRRVLIGNISNSENYTRIAIASVVSSFFIILFCLNINLSEN